MQSFQKLASFIMLMLLASKEAAALPQPQLPNDANNNIGTVDSQAGVANGNISPSSMNGGNSPTFPTVIGGPGPRILPGMTGSSPQPQLPNAANNNIGTVGSQAGVASGNISPSSVNSGNGPTFPAVIGGPGPRILPGNTGSSSVNGPAIRPIPLASSGGPVPQALPGNTAANTTGTAGNQIGVASGNISPSSLNARDEY